MTNKTHSMFHNQNLRLAGQKFDQNFSTVSANTSPRVVNPYIVQKWREYVVIYASERGVTITKFIAHKVALKIASRPFAISPLSALRAELISVISEELSS